MNRILKLLYVAFSIVLCLYLILPNPSYPSPPADALQSDEPGDTEDPLRKAYFTNTNREGALTHYENELSRSKLLSIILPTYRLNYPPEEAQTIIRDQTRSVYLEEIVHPFRESFFVNGFSPKTEKDTIIINDQLWYQKITVRFVPSSTLIRLTLMALALALMPLLYKQWAETVVEFKKVIKK